MTSNDIKQALKKYQPQLDQDYQQKLQIAKYTNLSDIEKSNFLLNLGFGQQNVFFLFDGNIQHNFDNDKIIYHTINCLDKKIDENTYTIVYIVADHDGSKQMKRFRKMLKQLPSKYFIQLQGFYVYAANFGIRTKLLFLKSKRERVWYKKIKFIDEVEDLLKIPNFQASWLNTFPKQILTFEKKDSTLQIKQSQSSFGSHLNNQKLNQFQIPIVIDYLLSYFAINTDRFLIPDIFRQQGSIIDEEQLQQMLINENYEYLNTIEDVRIVCSLIKKFFLELAEPLIPDQIFQQICIKIEQITPQTEIEFLQEIFEQLPNLNLKLLIAMVTFLFSVGSYSEFNRMNMNNLAIIFAPCFMRAQIDQSQQNEKIGYQLKFLKILFENFHKIHPQISFKLYLQHTQNLSCSSNINNNSTGTESNIKKNQKLSSLEDEKLVQFQQKQK
ncbi:unnamed protein product [Paramecium pentaurelia]|uniref:Rho-GAP domain-containing protein n=1 Tax=Paramecium pentaurelia TaxID=43138 RepID=A0A8S1XHS7_9CILI|nr:unnamed protein product [Paramecium pentaurelia]